jgi:EAL domain-containing protein (putative c-di-GMP-specific phosphodiesterase class I)
MSASQDDKSGAGASPEGGQELYLRLMNEQMVGWDDPAAMLERALKDDHHFLLFAQKILGVKAGAPDPFCYEILLRLKQEEDNLLPPGGFFPIAESLGKMGEIDQWVVRNLLAWGAARAKANPSVPLPMMCVNLSTNSIKDRAFPKFVREHLVKTGFPPRALCFELSEPDVIALHKETQEFIAAMKPGCRVTLDAFGSVKVSFAHLNGLAIDFIKIDGVITQNILREPSELAKARAICLACQKIGVRTIAEFVETKQMFEKLREIGVDYVQGFGIARPEPITKLG